MAFFLFLMLRARLSYLFTADWETFLSVGYLCVAILCSAYDRQVTFLKIEPMLLQKKGRHHFINSIVLPLSNHRMCSNLKSKHLCHNVDQAFSEMMKPTLLLDTRMMHKKISCLSSFSSASMMKVICLMSHLSPEACVISF